MQNLCVKNYKPDIKIPSLWSNSVFKISKIFRKVRSITSIFSENVGHCFVLMTINAQGWATGGPYLSLALS